ncbi:MAG: hypothetical protein ACP5VN_07910 [Acidobacteriota bacterium]
MEPKTAAVLVLAGLLGCAAGPSPGTGRAPAVLAGVERVRVVLASPELREEAERALRREGGPEPAAGGPGVPELRFQVACESVFDLWQPPLPINTPSLNLDEDTQAGMRSHPSAVQPACEASATLFLEGRPVWNDALRTAVVDSRSARNLVARLAARFAGDWRRAREGASAGSPQGGITDREGREGGPGAGR